MVLVILLQILPHKFKIIKTTKKIILKKKSKVDDPSGSGNSSPNTTPQTQDNQNHQEDNIKEKEQSDDPSGSGNSSSNTNPQIQDNQNHQEDNIKEKEQSDDPRYLLEQLEKIRKWLWKNRKRKWKLNKKLRITLMF
ncbi:hypothetical protein HYD79_02375 [Mycoplasmopsis bovis]|nr:hypothetical protein [Mycoplasmopsis bovis]QQH43105.1 hypothetical protein HYD79_02375 [Mycoplasmopsis bovis]